ncbi:glucan biosynthesis protein [Devosia sp. A8/3-2]|nr:glucan biosynthesis protein [Devosia sp. A8/3-2]
MKRHINSLPNRRDVLFGIGAVALLSTTALSTKAFAQADLPDQFAFDFDSFSARMKDLAATPFKPATFELPEGLQGSDYDAHMRIQFRPDHGVWAKDKLGYQVQAFHMGWLFKEPVKLYELIDGRGQARDLHGGRFRLP